MRTANLCKEARHALSGEHGTGFLTWETPKIEVKVGYNTKDLSHNEIMLMMFLAVECNSYKDAVQSAIIENGSRLLKWTREEVQKNLLSLYERGLLAIQYWELPIDVVHPEKIYSYKVMPKGYASGLPRTKHYSGLSHQPLFCAKLYVLTEPALELLAKNMTTKEMIE